MAEIALIENQANPPFPVEVLSQRGHCVSVFPCVLSFVESCVEKPVELVLINADLPLVSPKEFLELQGQNRKLNSIPIIPYGANVREAEELLRAGCHDYMVLPIGASELCFRVERVLQFALQRGTVQEPTKAPPPNSVSGTFAVLSLTDFIQMLMASARDGVIKIQTAKGEGRLLFDGGQVVFAERGEERGEDAFLTLLRQSQKGGDFQYSATLPKSYTPNIEGRTDHLLLMLANKIDEEN